jgi:HlyD family secretion protein
MSVTTGVQWRRRIVLGLIGVVIAGGLFLGFRPQPIEVDLGTARRAPLRVTVEQEGRTRVVDRFIVAAPVSGYARRIVLDVGNPVERGMTVAELEPLRADAPDARRRAEAKERVAAAAASLRAADQRADAAASNADLAQKDLQRTRALQPAGYVSRAALDRAASESDRTAAELRSARFGADTARHELEAARTALRYADASTGTAPIAVRSPVAGQVLRIAHKSEGTVAAGQSLIEIGDPRLLEVEVDLLSADAVRIHPGSRVLFERWGGDGILEGAVRTIEPAGFTKVSALGVEEQRVWTIVRFTSPPAMWQRLGDGYRVEASFILWEANDILQIPASALFTAGEGWAAFVVSDGRATRRRVEIGQRNGLSAQVISGVREGERVIAHPDDRVKEGRRVEAR